jgi:hypothetical protein
MDPTDSDPTDLDLEHWYKYLKTTSINYPPCFMV